MPYTLELYFTGLCSFALDSAEGGGATVLLVDARDPDGVFGSFEPKPTAHRPHLIVPFENLGVADGTWNPTEIFPDRGGTTLARFDLVGRDIVMASGSTTPLALEVPPLGAELTLLQPSAFDWVLKAEEIAPGAAAYDPRCFGPLDQSPLSARLLLTEGVLSTSQQCRDCNQQIMTFDLKDVDDKVVVGAPAPRAIADFVVLRLTGLTAPVTFRAATGEEIFVSGVVDGEVVQASLTNFDHVIPDDPPRGAVVDCLWYHQLLATPATNIGDRIVPWYRHLAASAFTPGCSCCPPKTGLREATSSTRLGVEPTASGPCSDLTSMRDKIRTADLVERQIEKNNLDFAPSGLEEYWLHSGGDWGREAAAKISRLVTAFATNAFNSPKEVIPECVAIGQHGRFFASGVVIHRRAVLTAGHVLGPKSQAASVLTGEIVTEGQATRVARILRAPGYLGSPSFCNDLSLLILESDIEVLVPMRATEATSACGLVVGFGRDVGEGQPFGIKQDILVEILDYDFVALRLSTRTGTKLEILANRERPKIGNPDIGDSGAPLYLVSDHPYEGRKLVGLVSRPLDPLQPGLSKTIYTNLLHFWDWIDETLKNEGLA